MIEFAKTNNDIKHTGKEGPENIDNKNNYYIKPAKKDKITVKLVNNEVDVKIKKIFSRTKDILDGKKIEEKILYSK
ncbi:MAG TPA: hypothetical protein PLZ62_02740 [bacterium]|nr:hypothetical protein [bacterium]